MKISELIQGTPAWYEHRAAHFNASDAPAMMGVSKYKTRDQLVKEFATGITQEFDAATERRFADGHRFESLARPLAEKIIGDELYPVVGTNGKYSASFDGITFDEGIYSEHKTLNDELRACHSTDDLHIQYKIQMEHQGLVCGGSKCLFMASRFDQNDELVEEVHFWYTPDPELRAQIVAGWDRFAIDVANYKHVEVAPEVIAAPVMDLPALSIQVSGSISLISNLERFGKRLNDFVAAINKEPSDDQGFADAEAAIKTLQTAQDALEAAENNALSATPDLDDMKRTVKLYADTARTTRLMLEKIVKARKESIRIDIVQAAKTEFADHCRALELEIKPITLKSGMPDFAGAIKGKKTIASLREAAATALRNGKMEADTLAADIRTKLAWCKESSAGFGFLFADLQAIITSNGLEAFQAIVSRRIDDHKAAEAAKVEAQRIAMQEEADRKAKVEADAVLAAERAKMEAEVKEAAAEAERGRVAEIARLEREAAETQRLVDEAKTQTEVRPTKAAPTLAEVLHAIAPAQVAEALAPTTRGRPTKMQMIEAVAKEFSVSVLTADEWIRGAFGQIAA